MPQGIFSTQLKGQAEQQEQSALTRTQRKLQQQKKEEFERYRAEAERIRTEEFVEKTVEEKYTYYIPTKYLDRHGNPTRTWNKMSEKQKKREVEKYYNRSTGYRTAIKKGYIKEFTGTRTYQDPFTFEEYEQEYSQLAPNIKQFFVSPQEITAEKQRKIQVEKDTLSTKISELQARLEEKRQKMNEYEQRFRSYSKKEREKRRERFNEKMQDYEDDIEEYEDAIRYANQNAGKIDEGATAMDIYSYAKDKADYDRQRSEAKSKAKETYYEQLASGELDEVIEKKLVTRKEGLSYEEYTRRVERYNKDIQNLQNRIKAVGFEGLTYAEKYKVNPSAILWQEKYPTEQLKFDKSGNVTGVVSGTFGEKEFTITEYDAQIQKMSDQQKKQNQMIEDANKFLDEKKFGEGVSLEKPKDSFWQNMWSGIKTLYFASPFGTAFPIAESEQKETTALREQRVQDAFKPEISFTGIPQIPLYKFGTLPLKTAWEKVEYQEALNYEKDQATKLLNELESYNEELSPEMKPYVAIEGLKRISGKGLETQEITTGVITDEFGVLQGETSIIVTDPAFNRVMSQNMLEWERELVADKTIDKGLFEQLKPTSVRKLFLETRVLSSKALETYLTMQGVKFAIAGAVAGYRSLGLPTIQFYKTIQLSEGVAKVPVTFTGVKTVGALALTGLYGYGKYKQYQSYAGTSEAGKSLFLLETTGELIGIEASTHIAQKTFNKAYNRIKNWNLETRQQADISNQGFLRENKKLGTPERVYMERYRGLKLTKPKTWLQWAEGYQKGQFTGRSYKYIPDEVMAYYKYKGDVFIYKPTTKSADVIGLGTEFGAEYSQLELDRIIRATPFPFDDPTTHLDWFMRRNIQEFGVGNYADLPIDVKGKGFGYSATGEAWVGTEFDPNTIMYYDASGNLKTLHTAGAIQYVSGKGVSAGFLRIFSTNAYEELFGKTAKDPVIYADYFDEVQLNKALREIKGVDISGRELKAYIYKYNVGDAGTLNIGGMKREVEGTVEIASRIPIRQQYAVLLEGWKVPIEEQIFTNPNALSQAEINAITQSVGGITELTGTATTSLPSSSRLLMPMFSIPSYPSQSKSYARVISDISRVSDIERVSSKLSSLSSIPPSSRVSEISEISDLSYSRLVSDIMRRVSYSPTPTKSRIFKTPVFETGLEGKEKLKRKIKMMPEIRALLPDFTSRALGIAPKQVSLKQALKEISNIQTGFEVRSGIKFDKKIKSLNERELMKGVFG